MSAQTKNRARNGAPRTTRPGQGPRKKAGGKRPRPDARVLAFIERVGNKVPHPAIMFIALCVGIIIISQILAWVASAPPMRW